MSNRIDRIIDDISNYYSDRDRSMEETLEGLEEIYTELEGMMECLEGEIEAQDCKDD